ncbi:MAG: hypothetical protein ACMXYG_04060 [Candidatus Woesearchaeota archaeon]
MSLTKFTNLVEKNMKKFSMLDFAVLKWASAIFGIILGAYFSNFVIEYILYFVIAFVLLTTLLIFKIFRK